jgi:phosphate-selective porin OprO/OprP
LDRKSVTIKKGFVMMRSSVWARLRRFAIGGCAALFLGVGAAQADDARDQEVEELKARLERVEQQNERLLRLLENGRPNLMILGEENLAIQDQADGGANIDAKAVEKIIADYNKREADKKKADDDKKKKEDEEKGYEVGKDTTFKVLFRDGVYFETADKAFSAKLRGRWHWDWGWWEQDDALEAAPPAGLGDLQDGTNFRRARLGVEGKIYEVFNFVAEFDFANGTDIAFREVWMGVNELPFVGTFKGGHFKEYVSLEQLTSSRYLTFIERSLVDVFAPGYNPGFAIHNTYLDERGTWATGLFRQATDNGAVDFGDGEYAWSSRLTFLPWYEHDGRCLLHAGGSFRWANTSQAGVTQAPVSKGGEIAFASTPEARVGLPNFINTGTFVGDQWYTYGLEAAAVFGPLSIQGEILQSEVTDSIAPLNANATLLGNTSYYGYYVFVSYFLTGEHRPYDRRQGVFTRVRPYENFWLVKTGEDGCGGMCCGKGAWEVAARYSYLDLNDSRIQGGALRDYTLGVNWYWNPNMKIQWNYIHTDREDTAPGVNEGDADLFLMRFAWDF